MTRFCLRDDGFTYKKIICERRWIGRVAPVVGGGFIGVIGTHSVKAATEREAFDEVVARQCGFADQAAMSHRNDQIRAENRAKNRASKERAREAFNGLMRGDYDALNRLFKL